MFGFTRVAAAVPKVVIGDVDYNISEHKKLILEASNNNVSVILFPELSLTAYSCADLFFQTTLIDAVYDGLNRFLEFTKPLNIITIVGYTLYHDNRLYNCAVVIQSGEIIGVVPKSVLPEYKEFYEKRWFKSGKNIKSETIMINGKEYPFGVDLLFYHDRYFKFGIEICEDLWDIIPPSSYQAQAGALMSFNLSASNELVGKASYRKSLVESQSARTMMAYIYTSAGVTESTTDMLFGGDALISENGVTLSQNRRFSRESHIITADIDLERLYHTRISVSSFGDNKVPNFRSIMIKKPNQLKVLNRFVDAHPFVPQNPHTLDERCEEIIMIQAAALAKRVEHIGTQRLVIGISGGLDSTLALLVCIKTIELLNRSSEDILAITMPGFGTTSRTYDNACSLCRLLGVELREISIKEACLQHFTDIHHDNNDHSVTYENTQARERTQILMDLANKEGGIVIGTGDLSEIALGWSTYNGDHMSMYAVNSSIPKTLISHLVKWIAQKSEHTIAEILNDIVDTPISPELLESDENNQIEQKTEDIIGPYELHDFFLYQMLKYGASAPKTLFLAKYAFKDIYEEKEIKKWLQLFIWRFFTQQFKRSCMPDGVKVGTISLSPRADWRMPSDASYKLWADSIKE
jgi:NAD+ synthase (glutamine-hydrolysing)